ncbi:MAG: hypothetical protein K0Q52_103 [Microbacterium sp.]|jgi:hypothetical protein|nr:hypothetical protein [Microbacterium sp.]
MRFLTMDELVKESGISRFTLMPALQRGDLHGFQRVKRGTWRVDRPCFDAWMAGEKCEHQTAKKGKAA